MWLNRKPTGSVSDKTCLEESPLAKLIDLAEDLGETPREKDMDKHGAYSPLTYWQS